MYPKIKRCLDCLVSTSSLILLSPLFLIIALVIKLDSTGPVLFKQKRIGKNKTEFYILKFRTMRTDTPRDMPSDMLHNAEIYITRTGNFLRRSSLDELPQLINILKGEMSFVGPRPALWNQYELIMMRDQHGANQINPGLTGWAQINGRDELPLDMKAAFDGGYATKMSFRFDAKVILKTITNVVKSEGVREGAIRLEK